MNATRLTRPGAMLVLASLAISPLAARGAAADARPLLVPARDVTVAYQVTPEGHAPLDVLVAIKAGGSKLRITSDTLPTTLLVDRSTERAAIVLPMLHAYSDIKIGRYDPEQTVLKGATFTRGGAQRVLGHPCTEWHATSSDGTASACITAEGVILRAEVDNEKRGKAVRLAATRVDFAPVPDATFAVPPDFQRSPFKLNLQGGLGK
jgi:hypothetical protein